MKLVYDIETDGLDATRIWCVVAYDIDTRTVYKFADTGGYHGSVRDGVGLPSPVSYTHLTLPTKA